MWKWTIRLIAAFIVGSVGLVVFEEYRAGYFSRPDIPDGAYPLSFSNGLRSILLDAEVNKPPTTNSSKFYRRFSYVYSRNYIGVPFEVAPWFEDAWSFCLAPTEDEVLGYEQTMPDELRHLLNGARFEAVCRLDIDGTEVVRGLVYSVPKL